MTHLFLNEWFRGTANISTITQFGKGIIVPAPLFGRQHRTEERNEGGIGSFPRKTTMSF